MKCRIVSDKPSNISSYPTGRDIVIKCSGGGTIMTRVSFDPYIYVSIENFFVEPKGSGFGRAGYLFLEKYMRKHGCRELRLLTYGQSGFWEKMGFRYDQNREVWVKKI